MTSEQQIIKHLASISTSLRRNNALMSASILVQAGAITNNEFADFVLAITAGEGYDVNRFFQSSEKGDK